MTTPNTPEPINDTDALILCYLDGQITADDFATLSNTLKQDPAALERFVELSKLDRSIRETISQGHTLASVQHARLISETTGESVETLLAQLADGPQAPEPFVLQQPASLQRTTAPLPWIITGSIAAVLALAVTLVLVLSSGNPQPTPTANNTSEPGRVGPALTKAVATLTAEHDAVWDTQAAAAIAVTGELRAGQRLTLTAGFAQITTSRGAMAVLEAPCTVELINENALRLHTGKLVGVCQTESSKGFVVRTPHMDVTDVGTRFGVEAARGGATEVHVFEGEVHAISTTANADTTPTRLFAGQSARASADRAAITAIDHADNRFTALMPQAIGAAGPAQGGDASDWQIVAVNGKTLDTPGAMRFVKRYKGQDWLTAVQPYPEQVNDETTFTVQTRFDLPVGTDSEAASLLLQFDANDRVTQVRLNGQAFTPPTNHIDDGHDGMHTMRIDGALLAGQNTLQLDVVDVRRAGATKWELRVDWSIQSAQPPADEEDT